MKSDNMKMKQKGSAQQQYAMLFGTYMGIYWILKFILFPLSMTSSFCSFAFMGLTLAVPYLGYRYTKLYRDTACGGKLSFANGWIFNILMYIFASLLAAVGHYIYFRFIDQGFIADSFAEVVARTAAEQKDVPGMDSLLENARETVRLFRSTSSIDMTMQLLTSDIIIGICLGAPTALFTMRRQSKQ